MFYLSTPGKVGGTGARAMSAGTFGCMTTPKQSNPIPPGALYAADNGKFGQGWIGAEGWFAWLTETVRKYSADRCLWATAPDVVGDAVATAHESWPWLPRIRALGVPVAYVAQDGATVENGGIPWGHFDVLFLGGSDEFKLGSDARDLVTEGIKRGVPTHMGRVNSKKRLRYAIEIGCVSADGTYFRFGPDINVPRMARYLNELRVEMS